MENNEYKCAESTIKCTKKFTKFKVSLVDGYSFISEQPESITFKEFAEANWGLALEGWWAFRDGEINVTPREVTRIEGIE